jgi:DivIVA domain-containing protein
MPDQSSAATEHAILAEITRPLEGLPQDPLAVVNADFPTVLRGYDRVAVDEYVRQTRRLVAELQATRSPEAAVRRALERVGEQISGILQRAHETAEQITVQSRSEAEDRLEQARLEALQIASAAEQQVKDLDADTDRIWLERQRIVADAEDLAAQLLALARTAGDRFPADAEADSAGTTAIEAAEAGDEVDPAAAADDIDDVGSAAATETTVASAAGAEDETTVAEPAADEVAEPDPRSEVEKTVAFRPLQAEEDQPPAAAGSTDDDDTAVIPPASQAANRRTNK